MRPPNNTGNGHCYWLPTKTWLQDREINLELGWKVFPCYAVYMGVKGVMQAARGKLS